jgi:RimJ/RimL family protein N-acetyltransferase
MEIRTERLILRDWRDDDAEPLAAMSADAAVMEHIGGPLSRADSDAMLGRCRARRATGLGPWAVEVPGVAAFIGFVGLARPSFEAPFTPCVEVLWRLARPHWGNGYTTEAARACLREGFEVHELDAILSFTVMANARSWRVMERIGMKRSPTEDFDHPMVPVGSPLKRHILYRMRRADWRGLAAPLKTTLAHGGGPL